MKPKYIKSIDNLSHLAPADKQAMKDIAAQFKFLANEYYLSLINWDDPADPIRRIILPDPEELKPWGKLDASDEKKYTVLPGLQHKYRSTALLLISNHCDSICRYCFRKRIFMKSHQEVISDWPATLKYLKEHTEIHDVLLTGGDPLCLTPSKMRKILSGLSKVDNLNLIRIGSKVPAFNPYRIIENQAWVEVFREFSAKGKKIYFMTHFVHPRELTDPALKVLELLQQSGVVPTNQMPIIRGVNDNPEVMAELFRRLSASGVPPYYIFQCRPAFGNSPYAVPVETGYEIIEQAYRLVSGLAKRSRFVMSHHTGKIQIAGMSRKFIFFKYIQAVNPDHIGRFLIFRRKPQAFWFDDYSEPIEDCRLDSLAFIADTPAERGESQLSY